jgi:hypothetical protein
LKKPITQRGNKLNQTKMKTKTFTNLHPFPGIPKGRTFKPTADGMYFFHSMTDEEANTGNFSDFKIHAELVEYSPDFKEQEENDKILSNFKPYIVYNRHEELITLEFCRNKIIPDHITIYTLDEAKELGLDVSMFIK